MRKFSVVFVALALVVGFSVSAMAAQGGIPYMSAENLPVGAKTIDVYGSVRVETFWQSIQPNRLSVRLNVVTTSARCGKSPKSSEEMPQR